MIFSVKSVSITPICILLQNSYFIEHFSIVASDNILGDISFPEKF